MCCHARLCSVALQGGVPVATAEAGPAVSTCAGNTPPTLESATLPAGCYLGNDFSIELDYAVCPATSDYMCGCVAPGGEAWVPLAEAATRCAKLAEFVAYKGAVQGAICRVRALVAPSPFQGGPQYLVTGPLAADGGKLYYGFASNIGLIDDGSGPKPSFGSCEYSVPDSDEPCLPHYDFEEVAELFCEQLL